MSVGNRFPKSQGQDPVTLSGRSANPNVPMQVSNRSQGHRTSYKATSRSKTSKVHYLTRKVLTGIGLSILLSFAIACTLIYAVIKGSPIFYKYMLELGDVIIDIDEQLSSRGGSPAGVKANKVAASSSTIPSTIQSVSTINSQLPLTSSPSPGGTMVVTRFLPIQTTLNCSTFIMHHKQKNPVMFPSRRTEHTYFEIMELLHGQYSNLPLKLRPVEQISSRRRLDNSRERDPQTGSASFAGEESIEADTATASLGEYLRLQKDRNRDHSIRNLFVTEEDISKSIPDVVALLPVPSIPNTHDNLILPDSMTTSAHGDMMMENVAGHSNVINSNSNKCALKGGDPLAKFIPHSISIGRNESNLSGTAFHAHRQSVSELIVGRKHWVIYPPNRLPVGSGFNPSENLQEWYQKIYPGLRSASNADPAGTGDGTTISNRKAIASSSSSRSSAGRAPIEIIQEAGQIVYVPEGWYHATWTLSPVSVAIKYQVNQDEPGLYLHYLRSGDRKMSTGEFRAAIKFYRLGLALQQNDGMLLQHLAQALEQEGLYREAEEAYLKAIEGHPRDAANYALLINLLAAHISGDASPTMADLLHRAEMYDLKEEVLDLAGDLL